MPLQGKWDYISPIKRYRLQIKTSYTINFYAYPEELAPFDVLNKSTGVDKPTC